MRLGFSWLRQRASQLAPTQRRPIANERRLDFEMLEDRAVPAAFVLGGPTPGIENGLPLFGTTGDQLAATAQRIQLLNSNGGVSAAWSVTGVDLDGDGYDNSFLASTRLNGAPVGILMTTNPADGKLFISDVIYPWGQQSSSVRAFIAAGDLNGDGRDELIFSMGGVGANPGAVTIMYDVNHDGKYSDDQSKAITFQPFGTSFKGAIRVAAGDLDGLPGDELVFGTAGTGSTPQVKIYKANGAINLVKTIDVGFNMNYKGGVFVAVGDIFAAGGAGQLIVSQGNADVNHVGNGLVHVYDDPTNSFNYNPANPWWSFQANFETLPANVGGGVVGAPVAAGDLNNDGFDEIVTGQLRGADARIRVFNRIATLAAGSNSAVSTTIGDDQSGKLPGELTRGVFVGVIETNDLVSEGKDPGDTFPNATTVTASFVNPDVLRLADFRIFDGNDVDLFKFVPDVSSTFRAALQLTGNTGGELLVTALTSAGAKIAEARAGEMLTVNAVSGTPFYLKVEGVNHQANAYDILFSNTLAGAQAKLPAVQVNPPVRTRADGLELNNAAASATNLGALGPSSLTKSLPGMTLHIGDNDVFKFTATQAGYVAIRVDRLGPPSGPSPHIFNRALGPTFIPDPSNPNLAFVKVAPGTTYYFDVAAGPMTYNLSLTWSGSPPPDMFEPNDDNVHAVVVTPTFPGTAMQTLTINSPSDKDVFRFDPANLVGWNGFEIDVHVAFGSVGSLLIKFENSIGQLLDSVTTATTVTRGRALTSGGSPIYVKIENADTFQGWYDLTIRKTT